MLYADLNGRRVEATPTARKACCPVCGSDVVAKCGEKRLKIWHWAHKGGDCDPWSEPETAWHKNWKELFPRECREVRIGNHRCDVQTPTVIIELQHSYLSPAEIEEREAFYKRMIWIFDLRKLKNTIRASTAPTGQFRWPRFRKAMAYCRCPVFIHLGRGDLLHIWDFDPRIHFGAFRRFKKEEFLVSVGIDFSSEVRPVAIRPFTLIRSESRLRGPKRGVYSAD
uniref:competence protein CoiA n=1 Tax=Horticoccus sp. 23ND18S-11 TaxID=3391832 RepID=UPI0039C903B0